MITEQDLKNICINVSEKLVLLPKEGKDFKEDLNLQSRLIFPKYESGKGKTRISEQESRVLFCQEVENYKDKEIFYSIETPTNHRYLFKGDLKVCKGHKEGQSALSDLSLFEMQNKKINQKVNIEFKSHNVEVDHIKKDLLKLVAEPVNGIFFHTLDNTDSGTLNNKSENRSGILDKYREIDSFLRMWSDNKDKTEKFILFAVCIIKRNLLLLKTFRKTDFNSVLMFFEIDHGKITDKKHGYNKGWEQITFSKEG